MSGHNKDYYKVLGLAQTASKAEIRAAYLKLAKQYHPDSPTGSEAKFKELGEAWGVLGNESSRAEYDSWKTHGQFRDFEQWNRPNDRSGYGAGQGSRQESPFDASWEEIFKQTQQNAQKRKPSGRKKTQYYEFFDPRTGRRVIYSFSSTGEWQNAEKSQSKEESKESYQEFYKEYVKQNARKWDEGGQRLGMLDILTGVSFFFATIMMVSVFARLLRGERRYDPHQGYQNYTNPRSRDYVWDEFAREINKNARKD